MGINLNLNTKTDYSFLFSSLNSNRNSSNSLAGLTSLLSDYSSIKSGSYGKLLKAYYAEEGKSKLKDLVEKKDEKDTSVEVVSKDAAQKLNKVQTATDELKGAASSLLATDSKSVFVQKDVAVKDANGVETTEKVYDMEAIYKSVSAFAEDYNAVLDAAGSVSNSSVLNRVSNMSNVTLANENALGKIGITVGEDGKLSVDEEIFKKADMSKVKAMFNETGSYAYQMSTQASFINSAAEREASKAATYTSKGDFNSVLNAGNVYNSYF